MERASQYFCDVLPVQVTKKLLEEKRFKKAKQNCIHEFLRGSKLDAKEVQKTIDNIGISRDAYNQIFQLIQGNLKEAKVKTTLLPRPSFIKNARQRANEQVSNLLGDSFHIRDVYHGKGKTKRYDEFNNIFFDLISIQKAMIQFYELSHEEASGLAKFVIKLDETEIVKCKKLERVSITLMNRALSSSESINPKKKFSVQSENNIWWVGAFEVDAEDFHVLHWVFNQTSIPTIINAQEEGALLEVDGFGKYKVQWHMAGDLKTLKCMYNISKGPIAKSPCLYCMGSARDCHPSAWNKPPDRHIRDQSFHAILNIPLSRVHICTLHALCRIIEKMVHLYIGFAWKIRPIKERDSAIQKIEKVLSEIGLHGGNVKIEADIKKSGKGNLIPIKPSIGGVKARRFLGFRGTLGRINSRTGGSSIKWEQWKVLHNAIKDHGDGGQTRNRKAKVWEALDKVFLYCEKMKWTNAELEDYKKNLDLFKKSMIAAWTDHQITHYMVSITILYRSLNYTIST